MVNIINNGNLPKGTQFDDGVRVGPYYMRQNNLRANSNGVLVGGANDRFGPAVLVSPQTTYTIVPFNSVDGNISLAASYANAQSLQLNFGGGDNYSAYPVSNPTGGQMLRFDWPRCVSVKVQTANLLVVNSITVFGFDFYGLPMQEKISFQNIGTYEGKKAFATVTSAYITGSTSGAPTATVSVQTTNIMGLPNPILSSGAVTNFYWGSTNMKTLTGTATLVGGTVTINNPSVQLASDVIAIHNTFAGTTGILSIPNAGITAGKSFTITSSDAADVGTVNYSVNGYGLFKFASFNYNANELNASTDTSDDTRGTVRLPETGDTWGTIPDGVTPLTVTFYAYGADTWENIITSMNLIDGVPADPSIPGSTTQVRPRSLEIEDMYGVPAFYTGVAT